MPARHGRLREGGGRTMEHPDKDIREDYDTDAGVEAEPDDVDAEPIIPED